MSFIYSLNNQNDDLLDKNPPLEDFDKTEENRKRSPSKSDLPSRSIIEGLNPKKIIEEIPDSQTSSNQPGAVSSYRIITDEDKGDVKIKSSNSRSPTRVMLESLDLRLISDEEVLDDEGSSPRAPLTLSLPKGGLTLSLPSEDEVEHFYKPSHHIMTKGLKSPQEVLENIRHLTPKGLLTISSILKEKHTYPQWLVSAMESLNELLDDDEILTSSEFGKNHIPGATSTRPIKFFDENIGEFKTVAVLKVPVDLRGRPLMKEPRSGISNHELPGRERMPAALGMTKFLNIPESYIVSIPSSIVDFQDSYRNIPCTIIQYLEGSENLYKSTLQKSAEELKRIHKPNISALKSKQIAFNTIMQQEISSRGIKDKELRKVALTHAIFASTDGDMQNTLIVGQKLFSIDFSLNLPKQFKDPVKSWVLDVENAASEPFENDELVMIEKHLNWSNMKEKLDLEFPYLDGDNLEQYLNAPTIKTLYITSQTVRKAAMSGYSARKILEFLDFSSHFHTAFAGKTMDWYSTAESEILPLKMQREELAAQFDLHKQRPKELEKNALLTIRAIRDTELQIFQKVIDSILADSFSPREGDTGRLPPR